MKTPRGIVVTVVVVPRMGRTGMGIGGGMGRAHVFSAKSRSGS